MRKKPGSTTVTLMPNFSWEFQVDDRLMEYEVKGNLTTSDTLFSVEPLLCGGAFQACKLGPVAIPACRGNCGS